MASKSAKSRAVYTAQDRVRLLLLTRTQKETAALLGVSERTIRRWKNENVQPTKAHAQVLTRKSAVERRAFHKAGAPHIKLPPPVQRRQLREYRAGKWTGKTYSSDWINYDVSRFRHREIFDLLRELRDNPPHGNDLRAQLIYRISAGPQKGKRAVTGLEHLQSLSDSDLWEWIESALYQYQERPDEESDEESDDEEFADRPNQILFVAASEIQIKRRAA